MSALDVAARMGARMGARRRDTGYPARNPFGGPKTPAGTLRDLATAWAVAYVAAAYPPRGGGLGASGEPTPPPPGPVGRITPDRRGGTVTAHRRPFRGRITEFTAPAPADAPPADAPADAPAAPTGGGLTPWNGVIAVEGKPTGDGRQFDEGALTWRELPLPLMFQPKTADFGHCDSYPVGRIDTISRDGNLIRGTGVVLPPNPDDPDDPIQKLLTLCENKVRVGPSVDLDDMVIEFPDVEGPMGGDDFAADDDVMRVSAGRIIAATVVATPAFAEVSFGLGTDPVPASLPTDPSAGAPAAETPESGQAPADGSDTQAAAQDTGTPAGDGGDSSDDAPQSIERSDGTAVTVGDDVLAIVGDGDQQRPVEATVSAVNPDDSSVTLDLSGGGTETVPVDQVFPDPDAPADQENDEQGQAPAPILASAPTAVLLAGAPLAPPRAWFADPQLEGPTPFTITDDGRVYGHLATFGTCHTSFPDTCVTAPREASYDYFHVGEVLTREGDRVATGRVTLGGGHADPRIGYRAALEHYDNAGSAAADVVAGTDQHGIWLAGALRSDLSDEQIRALRAAPLSGDWRRIGGQLRLMGALAVNVPGFPVPRPTIAHVKGVQASLAAAGVVHRPKPAPTVEQQVAAILSRQRRAEELARQVGRTPKQRVAALVASVRG